MDEITLLELALKAFELVSMVSARLGKKTQERAFGKLASLLCQLRLGIDSDALTEEQSEPFEQSIETILDLVEQACGVSFHSPKRPVLVDPN
jgi:hypothetical protein